MLVAQGAYALAGNGLVGLLNSVADDARYVPPLLDRLYLIASSHEAGAVILDQFWIQFLPRIPEKRVGRTTPHCIDMYERAIEWFAGRGNVAAAQQLHLKLTAIRSSDAG